MKAQCSLNDVLQNGVCSNVTDDEYEVSVCAVDCLEMWVIDNDGRVGHIVRTQQASQNTRSVPLQGDARRYGPVNHRVRLTAPHAVSISRRCVYLLNTCRVLLIRYL